MIQLSSKMMAHHSVMTSSLRIINFKINKFDYFSSDIILTVRQTYLGMLPPLLLINVSPAAQRAPMADTKCPPAAQRKQAKYACR